MSKKFDGFSEEEINNITKKGGLFNTKSLGVGRGIRRITDRTLSNSSQNSINNKNNKMNNIPEKKINNVIEKNSEKELKKSNSSENLKKLQEAVHFQPLVIKESNTNNTVKINEINLNNFNETNDTDKSILHLSKTGNKFQPNSDLDYSSVKFEKNKSEDKIHQISPFRGISLKDFEAQRKLREEENKLKKDLLYKAIEKCTQKTASEVKKIEEIKMELAKLDQDLASDVAILRKQIETACINYSNIEKHYNKVEQMFLKAKLELHQACEKKELLTEHLCTVITFNEDLKAKKLSELLEKVGLSTTFEN